MPSSGFLSARVCHVSLGQAATKSTKGLPNPWPFSARSEALLHIGQCCPSPSGTLSIATQKWESDWLLISPVQRSGLLNYSHRQEQLKLFLAALSQRAAPGLGLCCWMALCRRVWPCCGGVPCPLSPRSVAPAPMNSDGQLALGRTWSCSGIAPTF